MDRSKWEYRPFEDCIEKSKRTKQLMTTDYQPEGKYPIISQEASLISGYTDKADYVNHFDRPVVIFGDHTRILKYVDFDFAVGADGVKILIPHTSLDAKFLLSFLNWYKIPNLGYSRHYKLLKEISVPVPPISDQQRIVAELDCLNEMIAVKQEQLKEFDKLAQSIFYDMFGDPVMNEKGWDKCKWEDVFETKLGKMLDKKKQNPEDQSYPYLANVNVQWGTFLLEDLKSMTFNKREADLFSLKRDDLLICEGGESGRCAIWREDNSNVKFQKAIHRARVKDRNQLSPLFVQFYLKDLKSKGGLKNYISKATIEHLTGEKLNQIPVLLPPLSLQQQFAEKIEAIEAMKTNVRKALKEVETLFNSRMDYYFN